MIKLSDRLQIIADRITTSETMADIGTDHGFLPIYLWETGKCPKVILTDVSEASLEKARGNYLEKYLELVQSTQCLQGGGSSGIQAADSGFEFRVGDGLSVLKPHEVDTVVIAGMGGKLIKSIMTDDFSLTCSFKKYILQPRVGQGELRKWLHDSDFTIVSEDLVKEGEYIPEIITALSPANQAFDGERATSLKVGNDNKRSLSDDFDESLEGHDAEDMIFRIPPWIVDAEGPVEEFLSRNIEKEKNILERVMLAKKRDIEHEQQLCENVYYLKGLLKEYKNGK